MNEFWIAIIAGALTLLLSLVAGAVVFFGVQGLLNLLGFLIVNWR